MEILPAKFPKTDWVFFSSRNAVVAYFENEKVNPSVKYAAMGSGTASELNKYAVASFTGSGKPNQVAEEFKQMLKDNTVLFPMSHLSLMSIQKNIPEEQLTNVVCYRTNFVEAPIKLSDTYLFTSPSNVIGFMKHNALPKEAKIVAIGNSTKKALVENGYDVQVANVNTLESLFFTIS